eukprot:scaffold6009_cov248-Pinguiococcus_pyrenoidosus.AAC.9
MIPLVHGWGRARGSCSGSGSLCSAVRATPRFAALACEGFCLSRLARDIIHRRCAGEVQHGGPDGHRVVFAKALRGGALSPLATELRRFPHFLRQAIRAVPGDRAGSGVVRPSKRPSDEKLLDGSEGAIALLIEQGRRGSVLPVEAQIGRNLLVHLRVARDLLPCDGRVAFGEPLRSGKLRRSWHGQLFLWLILLRRTPNAVPHAARRPHRVGRTAQLFRVASWHAFAHFRGQLLVPVQGVGQPLMPCQVVLQCRHEEHHVVRTAFPNGLIPLPRAGLRLSRRDARLRDRRISRKAAPGVCGSALERLRLICRRGRRPRSSFRSSGGASARSACSATLYAS